MRGLLNSVNGSRHHGCMELINLANSGNITLQLLL